ncbi:MAG: zf-HC2 domain-containing protein [Simplicispira suum]|uniref:anti-sigma factor family protein n=1 Tax=Simplicispira suum TaxID=2109915 RepID=UPI001C6C8A48|nr:zf-HC2 domain-containing protein [Simplicispira suum]MBW7832327.1 zf-HC2 domain-containing protein [Simplicispira suum]
MTCPRHEELSAYADHMMKPAECARFRQHLEVCPICQQQLEDVQALQLALHALPSPTLGFDLASRLEGRLQRQPQRRQRPWPALWGASGWMPAGLTAGIALASGVWLGGLLLGGGSASVATPVSIARVFDPVPPGGLCAAAELCRLSKGMP